MTFKRHELSVHKNCLLWGNRVVIPEILRGKVLDELHISHSGIEEMKSLARCYVWWSKIEEDIETHVGLCEPCQRTRHAPSRAPIHLRYYKAMVKAKGFSPAEFLMRRRLRTVLDLLHTDLIEDRKRKNEELLDQRLSKGQLRLFAPNDVVYIKNYSSGPTGIPGTVIEKTCPLSYKNVIPDETQENSTTPMSSSAMQPRSNTPIQSSDPSAEIETPEKAPDESNQSRPQQTINRPSYLKDYVM
ncbi:hypothetical protein AVEN_44005-1 [Araneus ventricosus]|uniref:RNA-directed DNA polymerase n=1 Tax=Araneus ventricosus TaxID=182803 RepID=A0A4Y2VIV7_ARAVE|nr:hypothetical protein AVEN_44005-1 [Araneus ventricosus]